MLPSKGVKAESLINTLKKASGGVSAEELELRGLAEFAASKRGQVVTPADLAAHLKANPAPFPTVKTLGRPIDPKRSATRQEYQNFLNQMNGKYGEGWDLALVPPDEAAHFSNLWEREYDLAKADSIQRTKFSQYQVPGGENYRETLLKLPEHRTPKTYTVNDWDRAAQNVYGDGKWYRVSGSGEWDAVPFDTQGQAMDAMRNQPQVTTMVPDESRNYYSSHFDDPNIVAHTRSNERTSPTGERGTFLEEVQSDWHQQGKEKGYQTGPPRLSAEEAARAWVQDAGVAWETLTPAQQASNIRMAQTTPEVMYAKAVPDAPFKENWPDLSLKQALIDEANRSPDPGFLGFTGGKTQAARYDLSKQVGKVEADLYDIAGDNNWRLKAWDIDGNQLPISNQYLTDTELADHIGKDMARKIVGDKGGVYTGLDLQVGGEGMHEFYDKLLPKRLEKIVKPFGGTVEPLDVTPNRYTVGSGSIVDEPTSWFSRLTPEMKARILKEGLPLMGLSGLTLGNLLNQEQEPVR